MYVGKSLPRVDAYDKVTGRARYTEDLCDKMRWSSSCAAPPLPTAM